jgi:hypothetical protein
MKRWLTSGLLRRMLGAILIASLIPLALLAQQAMDSYERSRDRAREQSTQDLDAKSFEMLEARTRDIALDVADFLKKRENDLRVLATLPRTSEAYLAFSQSMLGTLWTVDEGGRTVYLNLPLYREVAYIDASGQEVIKIVNRCDPSTGSGQGSPSTGSGGGYPYGCRLEIAGELVDVSQPENTTYKRETYFAETMALEAGEIYVGHPIGFYMESGDAYAGGQNRGGERYQGVMRFATPVLEGGEKIGMVVLSLDQTHLLEFITHVVPSDPEPQAEVDPRYLEYAYIVADDGWTVAHPRSFNIAGVDGNGAYVSSINENEPRRLNRPGNLKEMGFLDPNFPQLVELNQQGKSGYVDVYTIQGRERALAYATIPYKTDQYNTKAGLGMVILTTDGARFHLEAELLGKQIDNEIQGLIDKLKWLTAGTVLAVSVIAFLLARRVAWPVLRVTSAAEVMEEGELSDTEITSLKETKGGDEVSRLARVFAEMAEQVRARERQLRQQVTRLKIEIDEVKKAQMVDQVVETEYFRSLQERAREMRRRRSERQDKETTDASET